jgi:predicted kinase
MQTKPQAIILIGIQASGKSTFYKERFFNSHLRISNDLLKTKNRDAKLLEFCFETEMSFVVDNTNVERAVRRRYIELAQVRGYRVIGYYFGANVDRSIEWNGKRQGKEAIPVKGILGTYKRLEIPAKDEGFDELYFVRHQGEKIVVEDWKDEV